MAEAACTVQRGGAIVGACLVDVCAVRQQQPRHLEVAVEACVHQRVPPVLVAHVDVGTNPLTTLEGIQHLERLRILFCTGCKLGPELPAGGPLSQVGTLYMLSLAGNGLTVLDGAPAETVVPLTVRTLHVPYWLLPKSS